MKFLQPILAVIIIHRSASAAGQHEDKGKVEMCLEMFPDYVRHCARNLSVLLKRDKFCADYSISCLGVGRSTVPAEHQVEREEDEETEEEAEELEERTEATTSPSTVEPDELPPPDFSLRRPRPNLSTLSRRYIASFCRRFEQRFTFVCKQHHSQIGAYGAAFCPTYSERCDLPIPRWEEKKISPTTQPTVAIFCKQIKITC